MGANESEANKVAEPNPSASVPNPSALAHKPEQPVRAIPPPADSPNVQSVLPATNVQPEVPPTNTQQNAVQPTASSTQLSTTASKPPVKDDNGSDSEDDGAEEVSHFILKLV